MSYEVSVILPTHNPNRARLERTLAGLEQQTLPESRRELIIVDNASAPPFELPFAGTNSRVVPEPRLGLTFARERGLRAARAPLCVFVDDDNILDPDYLTHVVRIFATHPQLGAIGGRSRPEFERPPATWQHEFLDLLALRDLGADVIIESHLRPPGASQNRYPKCAPIGAGMALRREPALVWAASAAQSSLTDRRGGELTSGGDNDLVLSLLKQRWQVGYFPELSLIHLIPGSRLQSTYLARLNRGIQKSWMQVLSGHEANPWSPVARWTVPLRQAKAWITHRAWSSPAAWIRWQGACGHFEGRVR